MQAPPPLLALPARLVAAPCPSSMLPRVGTGATGPCAAARVPPTLDHSSPFAQCFCTLPPSLAGAVAVVRAGVSGPRLHRSAISAFSWILLYITADTILRCM